MRLRLGEQADLLLEGQPVAPALLQTQEFKFMYPDLPTQFVYARPQRGMRREIVRNSKRIQRCGSQ